MDFSLRNNVNSNNSLDMDSFNAPLSNVPLPRWKRKALEASESSSNLSDKTKNPSTTPRASKRPKTPSHDRFIPNRSAMDMDVSRHALTFDGKENGSSTNDINRNANQTGTGKDDNGAYSSMITASLLDKPSIFGASTSSGTSAASNNSTSVNSTQPKMTNDLQNSKILAFSNKAPVPKEGYLNPNRVLYSQGGQGAGGRRHKFRHISQKPEKILDAPNLLEDYYLNLIDWGSNNILAVALAESVYLWHADTGAIEQLCETEAYDDCVTSVSWIAGGNYLAVGTNSHEVQIWDVENMRQLRSMKSHQARVGSLAWNNHLLSSGSRDGAIHHHDVRVSNHHVASLVGHKQEVCGLQWSPNGSQLASGSNDNTVCIWDAMSSCSSQPSSSIASNHQIKPKHTFTAHTAAVKALAWCPWQTNLLATGGGTADRQLKFWNTANGACVNSIDTKSQVCSIVWNPHDKELLTSHGFSQNQLTVWKYPSLTRMAELKGHTSRVLHTSVSPDGQTVVSGAADETLRFWKVFADSDSGKSRRDAHEKGPFSSNVRTMNSIR